MKLLQAAALSCALTFGCELKVLNETTARQLCAGTQLESFVSSDTTGDFYYITGVRLLPFDVEQIGDITNCFRSTTLRNQIAFEVQTEYIRLDSTEVAQLPGNPFGDDPLPGHVVNPIVQIGFRPWEQFVLRLDKDIQWQGKTIRAFENILAYNELGNLSIFFPYNISPFAIHQIHLRKEDVQIESGCYELYAEWHTRDGLTISDTTTVFVDLQ